MLRPVTVSSCLTLAVTIDGCAVVSGTNIYWKNVTRSICHSCLLVQIFVGDVFLMLNSV